MRLVLIPLRLARSGLHAGADFLPTLGTLLGVQNFLAQAYGFRRDFDEFVIGDKFDGFFEGQFARRHQAYGFIGAGRAHVRLFLFFGDVDVHVVFARIFTDDHSFVHFQARAHEHFAALLNAPHGVGGGNAGAVTH